MSLHVKTITGAQIKQMDDAGSGVAVIATLNVIDKDGDVTLPGAFGQQQAQMVPAHNWRSVPLGKATIRENGTEVLAEFQMNLDVPEARAWHSALKFDMENGTPLQEWSYGFNITDAGFGEHDGQPVRFLRKVDVHEISPVMVGAGEGTRTVAIKGWEDKRATPAHSTATAGGAWSGPANERRVRTGEAAGYYNRIYAWRDPDGDVGEKETYRFIHHYVDAAGDPGAASLRAAVTGIAVLNGARGGTTIPDADRAGVHRHLARHLRDADESVPELRGYDECATKLADDIRFLAWDCEATLERCMAVKEARIKNGQDFSPERYEDLRGLESALAELQNAAKALDDALRRGDDAADLESLHAQFLNQQHRFRSVLPK